VDDLADLVAQGGDQLGVVVADRVDGNAAQPWPWESAIGSRP
jgi:hypothetical protein